MDRAADLVLRFRDTSYERYEMRGIIGNDKTVWEAPGYEIPTISLTRFPHDEYHSSSDTLAHISESALEDAVQALLEIVDALERDVVMIRRFRGLVALSNPKYDLYVPNGTDPSQPAPGVNDSRKWNRVMDRLPHLFYRANDLFTVS